MMLAKLLILISSGVNNRSLAIRKEIKNKNNGVILLINIANWIPYEKKRESWMNPYSKLGPTPNRTPK